ncbi:universal stress protein [Oceanibium sediminis]|uniref:universal stress protein n=1 Tax=Oceanibium sediminis TaxID=2026339 RepID=UPI000DD3EA8F|nr:universal stress protein [Oceanibium sediminis]
MNTKPLEPKQQRARAGASPPPGPCDVLVFVDEQQKESQAIRHAAKIAAAFDGKVVLVHVLARPSDGNGPVDPVDWDIRKQKSLTWLGKLARSFSDKDTAVKSEVRLLEGHCIGQILATMDDRQDDIAAAFRPRHTPDWQLSKTACGVLRSRSAAILMIPEDAPLPSDNRYHRILVPLDGSARAEAALPTATMLASAENAELLLCYVPPEPGVTEFGVRDQEAERLHSLVMERNEQGGKAHLTRIRNSLAQSGLKVAIKIAGGTDPRRSLIDIVAQESVDVLVMATHGQSGHGDVPAGDVARHILDRSEIPVLMVRHRRGRPGSHAYRGVASTGVRQPVGTD